MLSFLTLLIPGCGCRCGRSSYSSSGLGPLRFRSSCAVVFGDPTGSCLVVGPRAARARQLALAGVSPARLVVRLFRCRLGSHLNPFSGFRVDPEPVSVSATSVKVAGVNRPVRNHTFSPLLALFFSFHDPNALRTEVLLQPWNGWQAYAFPPYALLPAILYKAPLVLWGPQIPWFPKLLVPVVDDSVALPLDRDLLASLRFGDSIWVYQG